MKEASLYIHIPFCRSKCFYCDFPSFPGMEHLMEDYIKALNKELDMYKDYNFNTVFIGGGTPTYLSLKSIELLAEEIGKLNIKKGAEFTIEANPKTVDREKLDKFKSMGVNRISIGLQSTDDKILKKLNRPHSFKDFIDSYNLIRTAGFDNVNIDIMFALPDEKLEDHMKKLEQVTALRPEHISCYSLIVEEGTYFSRLDKDNKLNLPGEEEYKKMYEGTIKYLEEKGYLQYEISNFAKEGYECRHNLVYWNLTDYVGTGLAAHSYINGRRQENTRDINQYIRGKTIVKSFHDNSEKDNMEEFIFLGLRKKQGISKKVFLEKFGKDIYEVYCNVLNKWENLGYIEDDNDCIFLTLKGIEISNYIMSDFIN
ncbi:MAG: radical SAM family heme chaperone HemW [Bacillota bacterium]|nr:radical SAM family heme chaperone HemW [Bacillota bacterium]